MSRFSGPKRVYDRHDIKILKQFVRLFEERSISVGGKTNKCKLVRKKPGTTKLSQNKISNPVFGKYKNVIGRKEPSVLMAYQVNFIIKMGFLPKHPFNLSHTCGRKNCFIYGHIIVERFFINLSRKKCHNALIKKSRWLRFQGVMGGMLIFCESCEHGRTRGTKCSYNF
jgi:hypothetical protein